MTEVVAALIWQGEKFMICQRPAHKARGLLWEFVGGKVEKGEKINVVVPTGNFGNIFAAYIAKIMGLPVNRFICASNCNNILTLLQKWSDIDCINIPVSVIARCRASASEFAVYKKSIFVSKKKRASKH